MCEPKKQTNNLLNNSVRAGAVLEAYGVADLLAEPAAVLLGHALGDGHGGHAARLRARHAPARRHAALAHVLRYLRGLARPRLADHY